MIEQEINDVLARSTCLYSQQEISAALDRLALEMSADYGDKSPLMVCVINGAIIPMGHLLVRMTIPLQIDTVHASRYHGEMEAVPSLTWHTKPKSDLKGRHVIIFDDILDGGITLAGITDYCLEQKAASVKTAVMLDKRFSRDKGGLEQADYTGLILKEKAFVIGFGLDYQGYFRNLPDILKVD